MSKATTFITQQREDGLWESRREGETRASGVFVTRGGSWEYTKDLALRNRGNAVLKARDGKVLERKDSKWYDFLLAN